MLDFLQKYRRIEFAQAQTLVRLRVLRESLSKLIWVFGLLRISLLKRLKCYFASFKEVSCCINGKRFIKTFAGIDYSR